jgi:hypothetical protein
MDRVKLGFVIAMLYNSGIGIFSKGFGDNLGAIDSLFSSAGCVGVQLWGLAYLALAQRYAAAPAVALVFCLEKLFYSQHWLFWMSEHMGDLSTMMEADPLTGMFFAIYGIGDLAFMVFFGWVAWRWRENLYDS